jgi:hypothetical protein
MRLGPFVRSSAGLPGALPVERSDNAFAPTGGACAYADVRRNSIGGDHSRKASHPARARRPKRTGTPGGAERPPWSRLARGTGAR